MSPPGRRRCALTPLQLLLVAFLFFSHTASAAAAVLGIDIGTEYIKAALVKPGIPLEIVLSKDSKRKEASAVAFKPSRGSGAPVAGTFPERLYGGDALALAARFPSDVYPNLKPLLAMSATADPFVQEYQRRYPALELEALEGRGTTGFKSGSFIKEEPPFSVEELLAMELKNVRQNAQALAGKSQRVESVVFTVPAFYTADERRAIELAAELAGLKTLALVTDGLAVGINYATSRTFPSVSEGAKPEHHLVFDMGAGSATATVLKFQERTVKDVGRYNKTVQEVVVLGSGWDKTLGGDALNTVIVDDMIDTFAQTSGAKQAGVEADSVKKHGRTAAKLWKEAERLRQVLSANQDTSGSFEGLYEDVDFRYKLSRTKYEELASGFADRVDVPIKKALDAANLTFGDLNSVILHGGAIRTPFIPKRLETLAGGASKLAKNVNADEAAVFGAAFKAASISPSFRVKEIRATEAANHGIIIRWISPTGKNIKQKLFTPTSQVGVVKTMPFKDLEDSTIVFYQQHVSDDGASTMSQQITMVETKNLTASTAKLMIEHGCKKEDIQNNFAVRLSPIDGLPEVTQATVSCEVEAPEKKSVMDDVKGLFGFGKKDEKQEVLKDAEPSSSTTEESSASSSTTGTEKATESAAKAEEKPAPIKKKTEVIPIELSTSTRGLADFSEAELKGIKERLKAFDASDKARRAREEDLNTLEAFTYRARDYLSDEGFASFSSESQRAALEKLLGDTSEWLYGEGASAPAETLKARLKDLKGLVDPINKRKSEALKRPEHLQVLKDALEQTKSFGQVIRDALEAAVKSAASAAEDVSKTVSSAVEGASESASSSLSSASASASGSADPLAELEEPDASSSSSATTSAEASSPTVPPVAYETSDLESISKAYDSVNEWLEQKLAEQEKLAPHDDPAIQSGDLADKARDLNDVIMKVLQKSIDAQTKAERKNKSKSKSKSKTKTRKSKSKTKSAAGGDETDAAESSATEKGGETTVTVSVPKESAGEGEKKTKSTHDEL